MNIPEGALPKTIRVKSTVVKPKDDHPPLGDKHIISPTTKVEPDGVTLEIPMAIITEHSGVNINIEVSEVWEQNGK